MTEISVNILLEEVMKRLVTQSPEAFSRKRAKITRKLNHRIICHLTHFKLQKVLSRLLAEFRHFNVLLAITCSLTQLVPKLFLISPVTERVLVFPQHRKIERLLCSTRQHFLKQKYIQNCNIMKYYFSNFSCYYSSLQCHMILQKSF